MKSERLFRVLRGGYWCFIGGLCRATCRGANIPDYRYPRYGFRLVAKEKKDEQ